MIGIPEIAELLLQHGIEGGMLVLFVWYFLKRDKEREESLVEEKLKQREEAKKQQEDISKELDNYKSAAREREAILMSENAKREELIRKESAKREQILREEAEKRETALMEQISSSGKTMKEISASMDGINRSMDRINQSVDVILGRMEKIEEKVALME